MQFFWGNHRAEIKLFGVVFIRFSFPFIVKLFSDSFVGIPFSNLVSPSMEQREGRDLLPNLLLPPPTPEATAAGVAFPARKLVRQLDFTGGASTMEQRQQVKLEQPPPQLLPHLGKPPQMLFMTMQQPPPPPSQPSIRHSL